MPHVAPRLVPSQNIRLYASLSMMAFLWGGTFVAGRLVSAEMPPLVAAMARFGLAALLLLWLVRKEEGGLPRLTWRQSGLMALLGLSGVCLYNLFFFAALAEMPASRTALFVAFNPIAVALIGALTAQRLLPIDQTAGICVALIGAVIVISGGDIAGLLIDVGAGFGRGELFMLAAVGSWVGYTLLGRTALGSISPLAATTWAALFGFVFLAMGLLIAGPTQPLQLPTLTCTLAILYLAIGGTVVPFVWFYLGVRELGPERTAVFTNLVPVFGVGLGAAILHEPLEAAMLAGGALVIAGVFLTNRK
ncbi:DMT family transporter [Falsiruegeria mediterranea]|uniref:Putative amino-acid metabolite efflux pump n=1 Tax=Falsiruegeria mediterranea M17 TaxID=1200281 RepID=A0A2R8C854_9RHOB|nr:DMT family transporter [Falsiruegeria mediterranea]SPJ28543.1 putative amino-acid metabolite efflux pump [Falsiruegeria mediterranea M17]